MHFYRNGDLNEILSHQTSRFHYDSKVPAVTITVFITILEQNRWNCDSHMDRYIGTALSRVSRLLGLGWWCLFDFHQYVSYIEAVLLVQESGENHRSAASHWHNLSHNVVSSTLPWVGFELSTLITDFTGSCKTNYRTIMATAAPNSK
jgi:hypothetical protein